MKKRPTLFGIRLRSKVEGPPVFRAPNPAYPAPIVGSARNARSFQPFISPKMHEKPQKYRKGNLFVFFFLSET